MANLREAYAATALAGLQWDENRERAVDRIAAAGRCDRLGMDIWRARYMLSADGYQRAVAGLLAKYTARYKDPPEIAEKVVNQAFSEFISNLCRSCNGAREIITGQLRVVCPACGGSGIRRYSDMSRARQMQLSFARLRVLSRRINWLIAEIQTLDNQTNAIMAAELERC